jgi:hypothetical protein
MSPVRHESNGSQILQLTEALNNAKKEIESQTSRMRDLEEMLHRERQARELAEELARRLEEAAATNANEASTKSESEETLLDAAFEPPSDEGNLAGADTPMIDADKPAPPDANIIEASATHLHAQIESMVSEIKDLRQQLDIFRHRAETAESERDIHRKTLAEMALQIRQDAEARELAEKEEVASDPQSEDDTNNSEITTSPLALSRPSSSSSQSQRSSGAPLDHPTLSRSNTITPNSSPLATLPPNSILANSVPYASMISVVLIGMGLMAYINGWQPQPRLER